MSGISPFAYTPPLGDWLRILPELCLLVAVFATLLADLALPASRKPWLAFVGMLGVVAAAIALAYDASLSGSVSDFYGTVNMDGLAIFASAIILFALSAGLLLSP